MAGDSVFDDVMKAAEAQSEPVETAEAPAEVEAPAVEAEPAEAAPLEQETAQTKAERARDESGKFTKVQKAAPKPSAAPMAKPAPSGSDGKTPAVSSSAVSGAAPVSPAPAASDLRPPQNWKPAAREKFATLPREVQEEAVRVHREAQTALNDSAQARKFHEEFQRTVQPYSHVVGQQPMQAVGELLQVAAVLNSGNVANKAQLVANIISSFGVPVEALSAALQGQPVQQPSGAVDPNAIAQQVEQRIRAQFAQQQQAQVQTKAQQEFEAFVASGKAEFLEDVKPQMGALIRGGLAKNLEEAYNMAVKLNPDISSVIQQREKAAQATAAVAATTRSRAASTSLRSEPTGSVAPAGKRSIADEVRAQAAKLSGSTGR